MSSLQLTLYHRRGCHLCDEMLDELEALCRGKPAAIEVVDIESSPELVERYGIDIPVLTSGGRELCRHRLDPAAVLSLFTD